MGDEGPKGVQERIEKALVHMGESRRALESARHWAVDHKDSIYAPSETIDEIDAALRNLARAREWVTRL